MAQALSQRQTSETYVLKMLSQGAPMMEILNELCNFIDAKSPGSDPDSSFAGWRWASPTGGRPESPQDLE